MFQVTKAILPAVKHVMHIQQKRRKKVSLEREKLMTMFVLDGGNPSRSNTTQLLVNVRDVNDNAPRFYTALFQESVVENVPVGHSIVRVQAYDADDGENARITYQIHSFDPSGPNSEEQLPFGIDPDTGWIVTVRDLDREENHHHEFEVVSYFFSFTSGK